MTIDRRQFLVMTGATIIGATNYGRAADAPYPIIDCHTHLYGEDEAQFPTIEKPYRPPAGKGTISHLRREMKAAGVRSAVAVQTITYYEWDNRFNNATCREHRDVLTGVCLMNPNDPQSAELMEKYVRENQIRGLRFIENRQNKLLDEPGNNKLLATCERLGIAACALVSRTHREQIEALAKRYPRLNLIIDHCLNIKVGNEYEATLKDMLALAAMPNIHAKLSYLVTGSNEEFPFRDTHESCHQILKAFGADRCIWGSDFPCELWCPKSTYTQHLKLFTHELGLSDQDQRKILSETPKRLGFAPT